MQNRICKYLRHPTEAFVVPANAPIEAARRADELEIDLCVWLSEVVGDDIPPALRRRAGGAIQDGDCDSCRCFEPATTFNFS